jgi:hypothetical protein
MSPRVNDAPRCRACRKPLDHPDAPRASSSVASRVFPEYHARCIERAVAHAREENLAD